MCGICGVVGADDGDVLERMSDCLVHRGPDAGGAHRDGDVQLANRRLSVIDVEGGDQPIYSEHGDVVVVYNGEIYNYRELRAELRAAGHDFATDSDTEVLVHGYEEHGRAFVSRLNGMFAFALYDDGRDRLLLARDRAGIKPLYYAVVGETFLFASEPKSILRSGHVEPAVDERALRYFVQMRYSPPGTALFEGVDALPPGHTLTVERPGDGVRTDCERFWSIPSGTSPPANPAEALREALGRAVDRQMISDVPLGFYLSGGLDTSSVVAMASERTEEPIHTYCMGFSDPRWDEREDARAVAEHFGTDHHEILLEEDFMRDFPAMIWHADEPKRNLYPYYVAEAMSEHVTVALGGLGADELFGGYVYRYDALQDLEGVRSLPVEARGNLRAAAERLVATQLETGAIEDDDVLEELCTYEHLDDPAALYVLLNTSDVLGDDDVYRERVLGPALSGFDPPERVIEERFPREGATLREMATRWDFSVKLPDDFLLVEDRMSMAHSLESRVPFLDNELVDLAFSIPAGTKFDTDATAPTAGKALLREAMRDVLPRQVFEKDKQGFTMPVFPFARDELLPHGREIMRDPFVVRDGLVQESYLRRILERDPDESLTTHYTLLWKLVAVEIWYQMYVVDGVSGPRDLEHYYT